MPDVDTGAAERPPDFKVLIEGVAKGAADIGMWDHVAKAIANAVAEVLARLIGWILSSLMWIARQLAATMIKGENRSDQQLRKLAALAAVNVFGGDVEAAGDDKNLRAQAIGRAMLKNMTGGTGVDSAVTLQPGSAAAVQYIESMILAGFESWTADLYGSLVTVGIVNNLGQLDDVLGKALGTDRLGRRILSPLVDAKVVTPFRWHVNKLTRPELLSVAAATEAYLSSQISPETFHETMARQGWSEELIAVHVENARKRLTLDQWFEIYHRGGVLDSAVYAGGLALGFDTATVDRLWGLWKAKRNERWLDPLTDSAVAAFIAGEIDETRLARIVETTVPIVNDRILVMSSAKARREYKQRGLSSAEERRLAVKGLRSVADFRRALEQENYTADAVFALELELRGEISGKAADAAEKAALEAERAAEKTAAAAAREAREAELAERRALPTLQEYRRAFVRGVITRGVLETALVREKVAIAPADLATLLADADIDRAAYLEAVERRAAAAAADTSTEAPIATIEAAVLRGVLEIDDYARELERRNYTGAAIAVMVELLRGRKSDQEAARAQRAAAEARARLADVSLPAFERAVRLGLRSRAQYAALLEQLETPDVAKALILDLLDAAIAQDAAARSARQVAEAAAAARGIDLGLRRRAVIAGVRSTFQYGQDLAAAGVSSDDQLLELALLNVELEERAARAARAEEIAAEIAAKRAAAAAAAAAKAAADALPPPPPELTLGQVERAVKLGVLTPGDLRAYLDYRGYAAEDVEIVVAMVVEDLPTLREAQRREAEIAAELAGKGVSLPELKTAVRRGVRSLEEYRGELAGRGYSEDAVDLLATLLAEEVAADLAGLEKQLTDLLAQTDGAPGLAEILEAWRAGELEAADAIAVLAHFGVPNDTATVYVRLRFLAGLEAG